ncbi:VanZ family protein [Caulobacter sp. S45]|uniref:VanZ family protein n=1 Tax=Caulobacter sp. S45 TaxID=1641861 RepID=UPI00131C6607|nr:VanZ family protein [Caulobacter sp. S45]
MVRKLALAIGWLIVAVIVFSTLSPIHLRPKTGHPDFERFVAFFLAGACFAVAYPRHRRWVSAAIVVGACLLEAAQLLVPGRDAHVHDAVVKVVGGLVGMAIAALIDHRIAIRRLNHVPANLA